MDSPSLRDRYGVTAIADRVVPGELWGHRRRGLIFNPVFALLPRFYLKRFQKARSPRAQKFWLTAFLLGLPHASYTALEIRHYLSHDGVADGKTKGQLIFFSSYLLFGSTLALWYVSDGARQIGDRYDLTEKKVIPLLSIAGSVGAVMGLQDVLVIDVVVRPRHVARAASLVVLRWRWLRIAAPWAGLQWLMAHLLRRSG